MKKPLVIHPFLFVIFNIFFLLSYNVTQTSFFEAILPTVIMLVITILLFLFSVFIFRDTQKAGIILSTFLFLFFLYGHIFGVIEGCKIGGFIIGRHEYLLITWTILFICGVYYTINKCRNLTNFTNFLNIMTVSLVIISLFNIVNYELKVKSTWQEHGYSEVGDLSLGGTGELRDIYYIILDGYASSRVLEEVYGYNNSDFTDYLSNKGFYVPFESRSNYAMTVLSLASSLNMEYINCLAEEEGAESVEYTELHNMIKNNKVLRLLKSNDYKSIHFSSGWGATNRNKYADMDIQSGVVNEFIMMLSQTTMISAFEKYFGFFRFDARNRVLKNFSRLAELNKEIEEPIFVFAHFITPHPPYLFNRDGEPVPEAKLKMGGEEVWKQKKDYLNQLIFVNKKIVEFVDKILSSSEVAPIIILQADHGPSSTFDSWGNPTETNLMEKMEIFNAYYFPQNDSDNFYNNITPVNTFRLIFNTYFEADYELLEDKSYYSSYRYPYKFIDVTDKVN